MLCICIYLMTIFEKRDISAAIGRLSFSSYSVHHDFVCLEHIIREMEIFLMKTRIIIFSQMEF